MPYGYALHIDATCHKGKGGTFRCLDGWTGWTLHAVRIGSENERELRPAVERTLAAFGDPIAVMRDLGRAGAKAVADCRQRGIPDLLCQYHFLAAVGHQLLDDSYALLRSQIARSKVNWQKCAVNVRTSVSTRWFGTQLTRTYREYFRREAKNRTCIRAPPVQWIAHLPVHWDVHLFQRLLDPVHAARPLL